MTDPIFKLPDHVFDPEPAKAGIEAFYAYSPVTNPAMMAPFGVATAATGMAAFSPVPALGYWFGVCRKSADLMLEGMVPAKVGAKPIVVDVKATEKKPAAVEATAKSAEPVSTPPEVAPKPEQKLTPAPVSAAPKSASVAEVAPAAPSQEGKPAGLTAPKGGKGDDLKLISGVGPKIEGILHELGIYHFDQIAQWTPKEVMWVDDHLKFSGRITREDWIAQAKALAKGGRDEYVKVFGKEPV